MTNIGLALHTHVVANFINVAGEFRLVTQDPRRTEFFADLGRLAAHFSGIPMSKAALLISTLALGLAGCVGAPKVDFSNIDSACAQQCSANHTNCMSGFKLFPLANEASCKTAMETCAQTCPTKADALATSKAKMAQPSAAAKLKEIDALLKDGLISKDEHEGKRQEILKAM